MNERDRRVCGVFMCLNVIGTLSYGYQIGGSPVERGGVAEAAPMNQSEFRALVAPIALYADPPWMQSVNKQPPPMWLRRRCSALAPAPWQAAIAAPGDEMPGMRT